MIDFCYLLKLFESFLIFIGEYKDGILTLLAILSLLLAFFTYKNAKKSLFNPIRGELVKYQLKLITSFYDNHLSIKNVNEEIDYLNIIKLSTYCEYILSTGEDLTKSNELLGFRAFCEENTAGVLEISKDRITQVYHEQLVIGDFFTLEKYVKSKTILQKQASHPELFIQRLYVTKKYLEFDNSTLSLTNSPFIHKDLKKSIDQLRKDIRSNCRNIFEILLNFQVLDEQKDLGDIYALFLDRRIAHEKPLEGFHNMIVRDFKVNESL